LPPLPTTKSDEILAKEDLPTEKASLESI